MQLHTLHNYLFLVSVNYKLKLYIMTINPSLHPLLHLLFALLYWRFKNALLQYMTCQYTEILGNFGLNHAIIPYLHNPNLQKCLVSCALPYERFIQSFGKEGMVVFRKSGTSLHAYKGTYWIDILGSGFCTCFRSCSIMVDVGEIQQVDQFEWFFRKC